MRKIAYIIISLLLMASYSYGQGEVEANLFSRTDLYGTARAISMGGAFGALGGDLTGVSINPAGIAVYRSSEIATTAVFQKEKYKAPNESNTKNNFNFHNLGFVGYFPTRNEIIPAINFGFSYNKVKSFDKNIGVIGKDIDVSLMDIMASDAYGISADKLKFSSDNINTNPFTQHPWLGVLGYNSNLIVPDKNNNNGYRPIHNEPILYNDLFIKERGSIDNYDFTVGTSINNVFNLGITLSITDLYYNLESRNSEEFSLSEDASFDLHNWLTSEGNGVGVKVGVIYRPIHELRLGLAYQSPTWYNMTDTYTTQIKHNVLEYVNKNGINDEYKDNYNPNYKPDFFPESRRDVLDYRDDYDFKTPDKWTASAALILGNNMILSMDYEFTNYSRMKYSTGSGRNNYYDTNELIKTDYKSSSTLRAGLEYRFTPQFYGRLGYAWMQNPYDSTFKELGYAETAGSTTAFRIEGDTNFFTGGLGYRFNRHFYTDFALVYKTQKDDLYPFPNIYYEDGEPFIDAAPYKLSNNSIRALVTVGYRF